MLKFTVMCRIPHITVMQGKGVFTMKLIKDVFSSILTKVGIALLLVLIFGFILLVYEDRSLARDEEASEESPLSEEDFDVEEYTYADEYGLTVYLLVIANNSDYTVDFECNMNAFKADGTQLGTIYNRIKSVEPGNSGCMVFDMAYETAVSVDYELYYNEAAAPSGNDDLITADAASGNTVTCTCTNTGSADLKYVRADIIYLNSGNVVNYDFHYVYETEDGYITPGNSADYTFECDEDFDDYIIYYTSQY